MPVESVGDIGEVICVAENVLGEAGFYCVVVDTFRVEEKSKGHLL